MITAEALVQLMTWLSPSFPTGGFAFSHGLEYAVEAGMVHNAASLQAWLEDALAAGAARNDAILLRHAYRGGDLAGLQTTAAALAPSRELAAESLQQGAAFLVAAAPWLSSQPATQNALAPPLCYPLAVGALASKRAVAEEWVVLAYLQAWIANFISAGVRLIPLGQNAGLAVQAALAPTIIEAARLTESMSLADLGGFTVAAEIASMRHETQYTRLFRS